MGKQYWNDAQFHLRQHLSVPGIYEDLPGRGDRPEWNATTSPHLYNIATWRPGFIQKPFSSISSWDSGRHSAQLENLLHMKHVADGLFARITLVVLAWRYQFSYST